MTADEFSDEILMAHADGELDPEDAARVEAALAADPRLARRAALFAGTRDVLARAAAARPEAQLPDALVAQVRETLAAAPAGDAGDTVVPLRRPARPIRPMALAASLALGVGLAAGLAIGLSSDDAPDGLRIASLEAPGLSAALGQVPSGERRAIDGGEVEVIASFRNAEGEFCREFEHDGPDRATVVSVACRVGDRWEPRFAVVAGAADSGYAPASSLETLDAYLAAIGASAPMAAEEESRALSELEN